MNNCKQPCSTGLHVSAVLGMSVAILVFSMIDSIASYLEWKTKTNTSQPASLEPAKATGHLDDVKSQNQRNGFRKLFRWPVSASQKQQPTKVEVVGSFTDWQKVPLAFDKPTRTWTVTLDGLQSNHTHRYVMLVDDAPTYDKTCDGLTAPEGPQEAKWQITTPRGPRVMLLFAQTK